MIISTDFPAKGRIDIDFSVEIEATNICNTHCIHCPREAITRPPVHMSMPVFESIAEKLLAAGYRGAINFSGLGEPTLNPLLPKFISLLPDDFETYITTNGATLTRTYVDKMLAAGLKNIFLSFNGADAATFARMSGGLDFERIKRQAADLIARAGDRIRVIANVSMTGINRGSAVAIKECLESIGVKTAFFSKSHNRGGHLLDTEIDSTPQPPVFTRRCDIFSRMLFIASSGDVLACCHDLAGDTKLGNLAENQLGTILWRKAALIAKGGPDFTVCGSCNDLYRFMYEPLPDKRPLFQWIYDLYTKDTAEIEKLKDLLRGAIEREDDATESGVFAAWLVAVIDEESVKI